MGAPGSLPQKLAGHPPEVVFALSLDLVEALVTGSCINEPGEANCRKATTGPDKSYNSKLTNELRPLMG
jgi:hypothetical protein